MQELAKKEDKLIFVDFYTDWCAPCRVMDQKVFTDPNTGAFMNEHFINYKVNMEKGPGSHLVYIYEVKKVPTLIFLDPDGNELVRKESAVFHSELKALGQKAMDEWKAVQARNGDVEASGEE